jgi:hypothetical protein
MLNINPTWAAPELLNGSKYTTAIDVYAMGIILWELLVRAHPYEKIPQDAAGEIRKMSAAWFELEKGQLTWFWQRFDTTTLGSLDVAALVNKIELRIVSDDAQITITTGLNELMLSAAENTSKQQLHEWYRQLMNIHTCSSSGVMRVAHHALSNAGIMTMVGVDHTVWCASTDFVLSPWTLTNSADEHGLHRTKQLQVLQRVQLNATILAPRLRTIAGIVRVSNHVLWVAVGNRWVVLDLAVNPVGVAWVDPDPQGPERDKFVSLCSIRRADTGTLEIWTGDQEGRIGVWIPRVESQDEPELLGEVLKEGWQEADGRPTCIVQATAHQVWVGTSTGRVLAVDVASRQLVAAPLPGEHALCHTRGVYSLATRGGGISPVIWSTSADRGLRRFSW